jgi:hypothetical protein
MDTSLTIDRRVSFEDYLFLNNSSKILNIQSTLMLWKSLTRAMASTVMPMRGPSLFLPVVVQNNLTDISINYDGVIVLMYS